jgi:hypothetical protein
MDHEVQAHEAAVLRIDHGQAEIHQHLSSLRAWWDQALNAEIERLSPVNLAYAVGLAQELHGLGTFGRDGPEFDWDHCKATMQGFMYDINYYFALARDDTGYVGAVCGRTLPFYFSPKLVGVEDAWYVRDGTEKRAAVGIALMKSFVNWCMDIKGAVLVQTGDIAGITTVGVDAIYRRLGFTRYGVLYKYERTD